MGLLRGGRAVWGRAAGEAATRAGSSSRIPGGPELTDTRAPVTSGTPP
ncbi:hypothetical protein CZ771_01985 [Actinomycetales bacterium JB111]|nr:hypothetical protein CZ771_01985 [Actinomycetales bacterium JB111]